MAPSSFAGLTIAIDAAPYVTKAWYNDVPSFFCNGATRTHGYRTYLAKMVNSLVKVGAAVIMHGA